MKERGDIELLWARISQKVLFNLGERALQKRGARRRRWFAGRVSLRCNRGEEEKTVKFVDLE